MATIAPKQIKLYRDIGNTVVNRFRDEGRKYSTAELQDALFEELGKANLNHEEYRRDIARSLARELLAERSRINPFVVDEDGQLQVDPKRLTHGVIRSGNGMNVSMADATAIDWNARVVREQEAAEASQRAATTTARFMQSTIGLVLMNNPQMKTRQAMQQLQLWPDDETGISEDDDAELTDED